MVIFVCCSQINVGQESLCWGLLVKSAALYVSWNPTQGGSKNCYNSYRYQLFSTHTASFFLEFSISFGISIAMPGRLWCSFGTYMNIDISTMALVLGALDLILYSSFICMSFLHRFSLLYLQGWVWGHCDCAGTYIIKFGWENLFIDGSTGSSVTYLMYMNFLKCQKRNDFLTWNLLYLPQKSSCLWAMFLDTKFARPSSPSFHDLQQIS